MELMQHGSPNITTKSALLFISHCFVSGCQGLHETVKIFYNYHKCNIGVMNAFFCYQPKMQCILLYRSKNYNCVVNYLDKVTYPQVLKPQWVPDSAVY